MVLGLSKCHSTSTPLIDGEAFHARLGIFGWPGKRVPLGEIAGALPTKTALISGFGVRITTRGWLYSVSGRHAVIVGMRDGKQFLIGTDEPTNLAGAINQRLGRAPISFMRSMFVLFERRPWRLMVVRQRPAAASHWFQPAPFCVIRSEFTIVDKIRVKSKIYVSHFTYFLANIH